MTAARDSSTLSPLNGAPPLTSSLSGGTIREATLDMHEALPSYSGDAVPEVSEGHSDCSCSCEGFDEAGRRNLVVCIDGTANRFGDKNTNVIELYNLLKHGCKEHQLTYYNSGIGTFVPNRRTIKRVGQFFDSMIDFALAWNFEDIILDAYRWLSDTYETGDRIFLFGFSRGAYQVRVLSAMIEKVGLIYKGNEKQIPFAYQLYADPKTSETQLYRAGVSPDTRANSHVSEAERFKQAFAQSVKVHFVGAWDTVSSVGGVRRKKLLPLSGEGMRHVCYFRHALALDEKRVRFLPEYAYGGNQPPEHELESGRIKEVWFSGAHGDVGGGYEENLDLNQGRPALRWMYWEAHAAHLKLHPFERDINPRKEMQITPTLKGFWYLLEYLPLERLKYGRIIPVEHIAQENQREASGHFFLRRAEKKSRSKAKGLKKLLSWKSQATPAHGAIKALSKELITTQPHLSAGREMLPHQKIHISVWSTQRTNDSRELEYPQRFPAACMFNQTREFKDYWKDCWRRANSSFSLPQLPSTEHSSAPNSTAQSSVWEHDDYDPYYRLLCLLHRIKSGQNGISEEQLWERIFHFITAPSEDRSQVQSRQWSGQWAAWQILLTEPDYITPGFIRSVVRAFGSKSSQSSPPWRYCADIFPSFEQALASEHWKSVNKSDLQLVSEFYQKFTRSSRVELASCSTDIICAAFSPDCLQLAVASANRCICIWETRSGRLIRKLHTARRSKIFSLVWILEGRYVVSGDNRHVTLWDVGTGKMIDEKRIPVPAGNDVTAVALSHKGKFVAFSCDATRGGESQVYLLHLEASTGKLSMSISPPPQLCEPKHSVNRLRFSAGDDLGTTYLAADHGQDSEATIWQLSVDSNPTLKPVPESERDFQTILFDDIALHPDPNNEPAATLLSHLCNDPDVRYAALAYYKRHALTLLHDAIMQVRDVEAAESKDLIYTSESLSSQRLEIVAISPALRGVVVVKKGSVNVVHIWFLNW